MADEMIVRVAVAIKDALGKAMAAKPLLGDASSGDWYTEGEAGSINLEDVARAAIEAMRLDHQADTELGYAGHRAMFQGEPETHSAYVAIDGWNAMIDEALSSPPSGARSA